MNSIIQQYIREHRKKGIDDYIESKKGFMSSDSNTKQDIHDYTINELGSIQKGFHEYIFILMKAIEEYINTIKANGQEKYRSQKKRN